MVWVGTVPVELPIGTCSISIIYIQLVYIISLKVDMV